eukprot:TRINITY_DN9656_c0_g1_i1.p1 TRINITY_DN9656_c0_g1~~TRINITY_DN9656_c0_g1_i1.p1  ORF type:complete len:113 (-),score=3.30 TRINITY_DN9656_c0_g1_i1:17-355(-)
MHHIAITAACLIRVCEVRDQHEDIRFGKCLYHCKVVVLFVLPTKAPIAQYYTNKLKLLALKNARSSCLPTKQIGGNSQFAQKIVGVHMDEHSLSLSCLEGMVATPTLKSSMN